MVLMFHLGRPDIFAPNDLGLRKGGQVVFGFKELPKPKQLAAKVEKYTPHRSYVALLLWHVANTLPGSPRKKKNSTRAKAGRPRKTATKRKRKAPLKSSKRSVKR